MKTMLTLSFTFSFLRWLRALASVTVIVTAGSLPAATSPVAITWTQSTVTPNPSDGYAAGVIDGRLVVSGGTFWEGKPGNWIRKIYGTSTHAFDPKTGQWEQLPDAPVTVGYPASTSQGGSLFVFGGVQGGESARDVYVLGAVEGKFAWRRMGEMPEPRVFANAVTLGSRIYVVGGTRDYEPFDTKGTCCTSKTARNSLWVMDAAEKTPTWKVLTGYPGELRWLHKAATDGVAIFLFGGIYKDAENTPTKKINEVLRYEPATDHWSRVADLPENLQGAAAVGVRGQIVLVSGTTAVSLFDPATASFTALDPLPAKATMSSIAWIDPLIVGSGGESPVEGPRRRSEMTFVGRVAEANPPGPPAPR